MLAGPTGGVLARHRLMAMQVASSEERTFRRRQSHLSQSSDLGLGGLGGGDSAPAKGDSSPDVAAAAAASEDAEKEVV